MKFHTRAKNSLDSFREIKNWLKSINLKKIHLIAAVFSDCARRSSLGWLEVAKGHSQSFPVIPGHRPGATRGSLWIRRCWLVTSDRAIFRKANRWTPGERPSSAYNCPAGGAREPRRKILDATGGLDSDR